MIQPLQFLLCGAMGKAYNAMQYNDDWDEQINMPQKTNVSYLILLF